MKVYLKIAGWLIALCGLWEFGDIAAVFVPGFGNIQALMWNHILAGFILMLVGAWAALTRKAATAQTLHWIASAAGAWLIIAPFILGSPFIAAGLWNDIIIGAVVLVVSVWAALAEHRLAG